jgi:hypothetical protein
MLSRYSVTSEIWWKHNFLLRLKSLNPITVANTSTKTFPEFLARKGAIHELTPPYAHKSNGLPEHMNRTIVTIVRTMTLDMNNELPVGLWAEAALTTIYLKNRLPHAGFKNIKSPYKYMFGEKPQLAHLYPFGTKCYVHIPEEQRIGMSKLGPRGMKAYVVRVY